MNVWVLMSTHDNGEYPSDYDESSYAVAVYSDEMAARQHLALLEPLAAKTLARSRGGWTGHHQETLAVIDTITRELDPDCKGRMVGGGGVRYWLSGPHPLVCHLDEFKDAHGL